MQDVFGVEVYRNSTGISVLRKSSGKEPLSEAGGEARDDQSHYRERAASDTICLVH
jgi:hypothetical protein